MRPTNTQIRHIGELAGRVLTREGADRLIRALLHLDGEKHTRPDRAVDADPALVDALGRWSDGSGVRRLLPEPPPIGEMIGGFRRGSGFTQDGFGALVGVTGMAVHYWESAKTTPRRKQLPALARVLGVDLRVLEAARARQIEEAKGAA